MEAVEVRDMESVFWRGDAHSAGMLCPALRMLRGAPQVYSSWTQGAKTRSRARVPSCSVKAGRALARSGVSHTWVW